VEELDAKQIRLIGPVYEQIAYYYRYHYQTRPCYQYHLSLSHSMKLCNRSRQDVTLDLRYLANTIPEGTYTEPAVNYDQIPYQKNRCHRPYRFLLGNNGS
jgi:hypothetical protein